MKTAPLPLLALAILGLAGCGDDAPARQAAAGETAPAASATSSSPGPFAKSFEAVAHNALLPLRRAQRRAAPGSLARAYFTNQADQVQANLAGNDDATAGDLTRVGGVYRICYPDNDGKPCYRYGNIDRRRGALAAFTVNDRSLRGRLLVGDESTVATPLADVELRSAYLASDGSLVTVLTVHAKRAIQIDGSTSYRATDGTARQFSSSSGLDEMTAGSTGWVSFTFGGPLAFGGTVDIDMFASEGSDAVAVVRVG